MKSPAVVITAMLSALIILSVTFQILTNMTGFGFVSIGMSLGQHGMFKERMRWTREHYKLYHPFEFKMMIRRGVLTGAERRGSQWATSVLGT
jgi:hypothetical protein